MIYIYTLIVFIFMAVVLLTTGTIQIFFLGLEIGVLIGEIIYSIIRAIEYYWR